MALREGKRLNQVIEEALAEYLIRKVSANAAGCLRMSKGRADRILRDEPAVLDEV